MKEIKKLKELKIEKAQKSLQLNNLKLLNLQLTPSLYLYNSRNVSVWPLK